jgi:hypothetical protein
MSFGSGLSRSRGLAMVTRVEVDPKLETPILILACLKEFMPNFVPTAMYSVTTKGWASPSRQDCGTYIQDAEAEITHKVSHMHLSLCSTENCDL